jgi:hypothetical protein
MSDHLTHPTARALLKAHRATKSSLYLQHHVFSVSVVMESVRYCVCVSCFAEMLDIAAQWERDYNSMLEDLRRASRHFLGFDIYDEWKKKTL